METTRRSDPCRVCSAPGCDKPHVARGYCRSHYRWIVQGEKPRPQSKEVMRSDESDPRHGTLNGYRNCGCRCVRCTRANADAQKQYLDADPRRRARANAANVAYQSRRRIAGENGDPR